ncbi:MAG: PQQ-binding-like beta-propeller repeat protein [Acidobacteria bacterium]|nr:PQQ-binding-like beta-propeller repeat protein [Acidobacteriota bacterium]
MYKPAWIESLRAAAPRHLSLTPAHVISSGIDTPIEARALADGRVAWTSDIRVSVRPLVLPGLLAAATTDAVVAIDTADGRTRWTASAPAPIALASSDSVILAAGAWGLRAIRAADGAVLWEAAATGEPAAVIAIGASVAVAYQDRALVAFDLGSGRLQWRTPLDIRPTALTATPERIFLVAGEGYVCAYRTEGGALDWCFPVRVRPVGAPLTDARHVYVAFLDAIIRVFDAENGARRRTLSAISRPIDGPQIAGALLAVPLVTSEFVVFNSAEDFKLTRVPGFDSAETPPTLQAGAIAPDGSVIAMIMTSPARTSLVLLQKSAPAAPPPAATPPPAPAAPPMPGPTQQKP